VNDNGRKSRVGDEVEGVGQGVESDHDAESGGPSSERGSHSGLGLESRSREGSSSRVG